MRAGGVCGGWSVGPAPFPSPLGLGALWCSGRSLHPSPTLLQGSVLGMSAVLLSSPHARDTDVPHTVRTGEAKHAGPGAQGQ